MYTWRVMHCYLPCEIEPFWDEPLEYNPRDYWHPTAALQLFLATFGSDYQPDAFTCWRRDYMNWHTAEELLLDEEKKVQSYLRSKRMKDGLVEIRKKWRKGSLKVMNKKKCRPIS